MLFFFDFDNYFKMLRLAWNEKVPQARYYYLTVLCLFVPVVSSFHALCFFLDGILFPGLWSVQVRSPIYASSIGRWRRYGPGLAPLRSALQAAGIEIDDQGR